MNWYKGGIAEAISTSKAKGAIFVVYIEGKDEASVQITQTIDKPEVAESLGSESFVAIKIEAGSVPHQQFNQIYKQTPIPSIYFIGKQGSPLEIVKEASDSKGLLDKINVVIRKSGLSVAENRGSAPQESQNLITSERQEPVSVPENVVCEDGVCTIQKPSSSQAPASAKEDVAEVKEVSSEEKVERAKQLIEKKRQEKQQEEEEKERQKEIERRKMGQNVQQMKRWQDDQELKNIMEERQKEKRENQAARDRVLAQIAQDKAERAARFAPPSAQPVAAQPSSSQASPPTRPTTRTDVARLQFKLPDGSSATHDFSSSETLRAVHTFIKTNLKLSYSYTLSTSFPRRQFTEEDCNSTLLNLELVPTAVILILPISGHGAVSTNPSGGISAMFWYVLSPFIGILGYLKTFIFGTGPRSNSPPPPTNKRNADGPGESSRAQQPKRSRGLGGETTVVRRQGNIARLSDKTDSDDENNTWNGNSTQQM